MKKLSLLLLMTALLLSGCNGVKNYFTSEQVSKKNKKEAQVPFTEGDEKKQQYNEELDELEFVEEEDETEQAETDKGGKETEEADDLDFDAIDEQTNLKTVYVEFDRFKLNDLKEDQKQILADNIEVMKQLVSEDNDVVIEGHACQYGKNKAYNVALSQKRAWQLAQACIEQGVPQEHIKVVGRGQAAPAVEGLQLTPEAQWPNRRVEIYVPPVA